MKDNDRDEEDRDLLRRTEAKTKSLEHKNALASRMEETVKDVEKRIQGISVAAARAAFEEVKTKYEEVMKKTEQRLDHFGRFCACDPNQTADVRICLV